MAGVLSLQITFICLIYPVLVLCYAGQAAYISKNLHVEDFNHLSESVPGMPFMKSEYVQRGRCIVCR